MASAASGADQLKEEKLRYIAAAELEAAQVENADYWDLSSEDECLSAQSQPRFPDSSTSQAVASGAGRTMSEAEPLAGMDKHHILSCHSGLPQHAILVARVKQMLQQHEMVRKCGRQSMTKSA